MGMKNEMLCNVIIAGCKKEKKKKKVKQEETDENPSA